MSEWIEEEDYIKAMCSSLSLSLVCKWNTMMGEPGEITAIQSNLIETNFSYSKLDQNVLSSLGISKQLQTEFCLRLMVLNFY